MTDLITSLQLVIIVIYVSFIYRRYGVIGSISTSSYKLKGQERWYFTAFLWGIAILNLFQGLGLYGVITTAGLIFSGITIEHRRFGGRQFHYVGTIIAILAAFSGLFFLYGMWIPTVALLVGIALLYKNENFIWWIEIVAFGLVLGSYYLR